MGYADAVAASGDVVAVGAYRYGTGGGVYLFVRNQGGINNWGEFKIITPSDPQESDFFGSAVAMSGDLLVVGAYGTDGGPANSFTRAGAAYIYARNQGGTDNWGLVKKLTAGDPGSIDEFGVVVAISGDLIVAGASDANFGVTLGASGAAYVFARHQGGADNWGQVKKLTASDPDDFDHFGDSVTISGDVIAIGAAQEDAGALNLEDAGAAYVYMRNQGGANNWGQVKKLLASDPQAYDYFGGNLALSGDTLVVGASGEDAGALNLERAGAAYVFMRNQGGANQWGHIKKLLASDPHARDNFGTAVAIIGDDLVIGADGKDFGDDPFIDTGGLYILKRNLGGTNNWGEAYALGNGGEYAYMADSVALTGSGLIVAGAPGALVVGPPEVEAGGAAYAFCLDDVHENNDSTGLATGIGASLLDLQMCGNNADYFAVPAEAGERIDIRVYFPHAQGDLDMAVYESDGTSFVAGAQSVDDNEFISFTAASTMTYYVKVYGYEGALNRYSLTVSTSSVYLPLVLRK